jgi:hypothetical protein
MARQRPQEGRLMFMLPIVIFAALGVPVGLLVSWLTGDLVERFEFTVAGTVVVSAILAFVWRKVRTRETHTPEDARLAWLDVPSIPAKRGKAGEVVDAGAVDSWAVLNPDRPQATQTPDDEP